MRAVIVYTLEEALAALAADEAVLQSAPSAVEYAGSLYLLHLFAEAKKAYPRSKAIFIVDCGGGEAEALQAMQTGHKHLRMLNPKSRIREIAKARGIKIYSSAYEALDLSQARNTKDGGEKSCEPHKRLHRIQ